MNKRIRYLKKFWILIIPIIVFVLFEIDLMLGEAEVIDGDTLSINGQKVRLYGIDAVEKAQKCKTKSKDTWLCGLEAKQYLELLVEDKMIYCFMFNKDRYNRKVSVCYNSEFQDLSSEMVKNGYAVAYRKYGDRYVEEEREAKRKKIGIWGGQFVMPEKYRFSKAQ